MGSLFFLVSCQEDHDEEIVVDNTSKILFDADSETPLVEYIINPKNKQSILCNRHVKKSLNYAKIPYRQRQLKEFNQNPNLSPSTQVLAIYNLTPLSENATEKILEFVSSGGTIFVATASEDARFGYFAGLKTNANYETDVTTVGYRFRTNLLPDMNGKTYQNNTSHYGLKKANFSDKIDIWATAVNEPDTPTVLQRDLGQGHVVVLNTTQDPEKNDRGIFFASILYGLPNIPYPIANTSSIFLDDFPAPLYNIVKEPIASEMNKSELMFYTDVWWPDLKELARKESLKYTAMACFDYRNKTKPPFLFPEWKSAMIDRNGKQTSATSWLMQDVTKNGHELALHGYNHVSLMKDDWPNPEYMSLSLKSAQKIWSSSRYGKFPVTYVPPSNDIDSIGLKALHEGMPSIRYVCSTYSGDFAFGGDREFDPEPHLPSLFDFPRVTSGYIVDDRMEFDQQSLYLYTGIWTHFIHSDDVYQIPDESNVESRGVYEYRNKNGLGWRTTKDGTPGLFPRFEKYIQHTRAIFPMMRFLTVNKAAPKVQKWRKQQYDFKHGGQYYKVALKNASEKKQETYWFSYVPTANQEKIENYLNDQDYQFSKTAMLDGFLYNIKTSSPTLELPMVQKIEPSTDIFESIYKQYKAFIENRSQQIAQGKAEVLKDKEQKESELQIQKLSSTILQQKNINPKDWASLYANLKSVGNEEYIWPLLDKKYIQQPNLVLLDIARNISTKTSYPDDQTQKRWMLRQLKAHPDNLSLKASYVNYYGQKDDINLSFEELEKLYSKSATNKVKESYLEILLAQYPSKSKVIVDAIPVCSATISSRMASNLTYFYSNLQENQKALEWSSCAKNIPEEDVMQWRVNTGDYKDLKTTDYPRYISYLLSNRPKLATEELIEEKPCDAALSEQSEAIAYAYGDQGSFRKALVWSACVPDFSIQDRLQWHIELNDTIGFAQTYQKYTQLHPNDDAISVFVAETYLDLGQSEKAWKIATALKNPTARKKLRRRLNRRLPELPLSKKQKLLQLYPDLFYSEAARKTKKEIRLQTGDFIDLSSNLIADRLDPTSFGNKLSYGIRDKKLQTHTLGITQYKAYALAVDSIFKPNEDHSLLGLEYTFLSAEKYKKAQYSAKIRSEFDKQGRTFWHLSAGISKSKDSLYSSASLSFRPAITAPAYDLSIYQTKLEVYKEWQMSKRFRGILNLEGNYYTDQVTDGQLSLNLAYKINLSKKAKILPYTEVSGMLGSEDRENGYPYWTLKNRFYGGAGLSFQYENKINHLKFSLDAAIFFDTYSDSFQRYRGQLSYPLWDYWVLQAGAEFYTLKNFYSNNFTFGLRYYLGSK